MPDFWRNSGFHLLRRNAAGQLEVTDDFLRAYLLRPEIHPVEESCDRERALHAALMERPREAVAEADVDAIADEDTRENYRVLLRFRRRLLDAGTVERCYAGLFQGNVDVPPLFVAQLAHVVLRNVLEGCDDALQARAAELFFRDQKATFRDGHALLADQETVDMHAAGSRYGSIGRLIVEAQGSLGTVELDVLDRGNAAAYWERESRHDTVISLTYGSAALDALCRVVESWVAHLLGVTVRVTALREIDEARWAWHVGLDAESTAILNDLWNGREVEHGRMRRVIALFRLDFADRVDMRADVSGKPVYLALAANEEDVVRMKPQNLLLNLPLATRS
jgi:hypothetical protein